MNMIHLFNKILISISDFLNGSRPVSYVRKFQFYLLASTLIMFSAVLSYPNFRHSDLDLRDNGPWAVGKEAPSSVVAFSDIEFPNQQEYELKKQEAISLVPLYFDRDFSVLSATTSQAVDEKEKMQKFQDLLNEDLKSIRKCQMIKGEVDAKIYCIRRIKSFSRLGEKEALYILYPSVDKTGKKIRQAVNLIFQKYLIIHEPVKDKIFTGNFVRVRDFVAGVEPAESTINVKYLIAKNRIHNKEVRGAFYDLINERMNIKYNTERHAIVKSSAEYLRSIDGCSFNAKETEASRLKEASKVQMPIYKIPRGKPIVNQGEVIRDNKFQALKVYNHARLMDKVRRIIAILIQQIVLISLILYFAWRFSSVRLTDISSNLVIFLTVWIFAAVLAVQEEFWSRNLAYNEVTHFFGSWVPVGFFVLLLSVMFGEIITLPVGIYLSFMVFLASKNDGNSLIISVTMAVAGSILGSYIKRRAHFFYFSVVLAGIGSLMVTASYLYSNRDIFSFVGGDFLFSEKYFHAVRVIVFSSMASMLIIAILPIYEMIFNVATRFKLIELSDPSHSLLKDLFHKAPSTWTHTLMVAAMSEKACERLNLDTMLTRTGVYYHDIGKMKNAGFFVENQHLIPKPENIDKDNPQVAAKVIIDHVLDGVEMAKKARLPREVIAFIPEHHGTSTMAFFYHKALEKYKRKVKRDDFRYPGPRPRRKETAIVMIADSVEAASRSLQDVNEESLDLLIQKIINLKLSENQLDDSGLTVGDLTEIRESFKDVLMSSYHFRPAYPASGDTEKLEQEKENGRNRQKKAFSLKSKKSPNPTKGKK